MYEAAKVKFTPYYVDGAGHNNIEKYASDYCARIKMFIQHVDQLIKTRNEKRLIE